MRKRVEELVETANMLPLSEQFELLARLSVKLQSRFRRFEQEHEPGVRKGDTLDELIKAQGIEPKPSIQAYRKDLWPEDEGADDFLSFLEEQRIADKERDS